MNLRGLVVGIFLLGCMAAPAGAQEAKYLPCNIGPDMLRLIDDREREGNPINLAAIGLPATPETLAGKFIGDCSQQLADVAAVAAVEADSPLKIVVAKWQTNLDFMKWWLQNRRAKKEQPAKEK